MRAGDLRHFIDIEYQAPGASDGMGNAQTVWTILYENVPASFKTKPAVQTWVGDKPQSQSFVTICTRYIAGVNESMRINHTGKLYSIVDIDDVLERHIELDFQCKEIVPVQPAITVKTMSGRASLVAA